jgi:hypothetical protein
MHLSYAVDRLYEIGWLPDTTMELERLEDGRRYPSAGAVSKHFKEAGLDLAIKHNAKFNCYHATWAPCGEKLDPGHTVDERHGTVVGNCQREAAVYALAQLLAAKAELSALTV